MVCIRTAPLVNCKPYYFQVTGLKYANPAMYIAAGCSSTYSGGVRLFTYPKDLVMIAEWVRQVQRTRAQLKPSSSVLCSNHFTDDCFDPGFAAHFGIKYAKKHGDQCNNFLFLMEES